MYRRSKVEHIHHSHLREMHSCRENNMALNLAPSAVAIFSCNSRFVPGGTGLGPVSLALSL